MKKIIYVSAAVLFLFTLNSCNKEKSNLNSISSSSHNEDFNSLSKNTKPDKGELCHNGRTISVNKNAIPSHIGHGDMAGTCDNPLPENFWYEKAGIASITENKNNKLITDVFFATINGNIKNEFYDILSDEYLPLDSEKGISFAFESKINPQKTLLISFKNGEYRSRILTLSNTDIIISDISGVNSINVPYGHVPVGANCDNLGPRGADESFSDCFVRNFSNFCCDFIGCVAVTTKPLAVGLAVEAVCIFT